MQLEFGEVNTAEKNIAAHTYLALPQLDVLLSLLNLSAPWAYSIQHYKDTPHFRANIIKNMFFFNVYLANCCTCRVSLAEKHFYTVYK